MELLKWWARYLMYGWLFEYHGRKCLSLNHKHQTALRYHFEMVDYYHRKINGGRE